MFEKNEGGKIIVFPLQLRGQCKQGAKLPSSLDQALADLKRDLEVAPPAPSASCQPKKFPQVDEDSDEQTRESVRPPLQKEQKIALEKTKALMATVCHDELEWLVYHSDVPAKSLLLACQKKVLVCENGRLKRSAFFKYAVGWMTIAYALYFFCRLALALAAYQLSQSNIASLAAWMFVCVICIWTIERQLIYPHSVAKKALKARARGLSHE